MLKNNKITLTSVMRYQLGPLLKFLNTIVLWSLGGFREPLIEPPMMPRDERLSDSCTSEKICYISPNSTPRRFPSYLLLALQLHFLFIFCQQTQHQDDSRLIFPWPFTYISYSSFAFPGSPCRSFFLNLLRLPCQFYLVVIEQQHVGLFAHI